MRAGRRRFRIWGINRLLETTARSDFGAAVLFVHHVHMRSSTSNLDRSLRFQQPVRVICQCMKWGDFACGGGSIIHLAAGRPLGFARRGAVLRDTPGSSPYIRHLDFSDCTVNPSRVRRPQFRITIRTSTPEMGDNRGDLFVTLARAQ